METLPNVFFAYRYFLFDCFASILLLTSLWSFGRCT